MGLWQALVLLMAAQANAGAAEPRIPTIESLVAGAEACATRALSNAKMAERLTGLGWMTGESVEPGKGMRMSTYTRADVTIYHFTSKEMKQCIARGPITPDFQSEMLLTTLTAKLGKAPKVEEPGKRYLYFLPRLDILTVQIKSDDKDPHIEMSVVH